ncbi:MAG: carbohydrate ABC transporter permease [Defluviitaleaceae bacterium]|nr:carbohydrate ABC transporter permease [Defluviitaleaceae bacterium]
MDSYRIKQFSYKFICYTFLIILFLICVLPIYMLLINATRTTEAINAGFSLIPGTNIINNWNIIQGFGINIPLGLRNSLIIAISTTFLSVYFSLLTAYAINIYDFKFKKAFYGFILAMTLVPMNLYLIGFFQYMHHLGMLNSLTPMILPSIAAPGTVFFFKQYLDSALVPELIQAARIDGATEFEIFNKIVLPISKPGAFTMAIFAFVGSWNAFMGPLFIIGGNINLHTLPLIMQRLQGDAFRTDFGAIYLGMAISLIPIIIVYSIFSKYIVSGITLGSVKE